MAGYVFCTQPPTYFNYEEIRWHGCEVVLWLRVSVDGMHSSDQEDIMKLSWHIGELTNTCKLAKLWSN